MIYIIAILIFLVLKFVLNYRKHLLCKKYLKHYIQWLSDKCEINLLEKQAEVKKLVEDAGYGRGKVAHTELVGYGQIANYIVNPMDAFPSKYEHIAHAVIANLTASVGVYKKRAFDAFNLFYWIDLIVFLPRNIARYLGAKNDGIIIKISNLLWWIFDSVIVTIILSSYSSELSKITRNLFQSLFK
jgi:hypothetical protein